MKNIVLEGCVVTLTLMAVICHGYPTPLELQDEKVEPSMEEGRKLGHDPRRSIRPFLKPSVSSEELEDSLEVNQNQFQNSTETDEVSVVDEENIFLRNITMESREDKGIIQKREDTASRSKGFTSGPNFETDRIGFLYGFLPFLGFKNYRPYSGRAHWYTSRPNKPSSQHRPNHYKPSPHPSNQYPHEPDYKPHESDYEGHKPLFIPHEPDYESSKPSYEPDYESPKPDPLPPFPPDGPTFGDYMADFPGHPPPFFDHDEDEEDYNGPKKPPHFKPHPSDSEGFDNESFEFDFDPPDFFEHSGFPHPSEEDHYEEQQYEEQEHEEQEHEENPHDDHHDGDVEYPMKPYSDDDELEFFPPETYEGFEPIIYKGPPNPDKHIAAGPKPRPPNPHKFMYPPDLNIIVQEGIYRDDIPVKDIHNDRDQITDDLNHGGIKGLDPEVIDFIQTNTKPYVDTHMEYDDQWSRKITTTEIR